MKYDATDALGLIGVVCLLRSFVCVLGYNIMAESLFAHHETAIKKKADQRMKQQQSINQSINERMNEVQR